MHFRHQITELPASIRIFEDGRRKYKTPAGEKYPSITAILSKTKDMSGLESWRQDVGESVADYIMKQANTIGIATHEIIESYLSNNKKDDFRTKPLLARAHFNNLRQYLDKINDIRGLEVPLYSDMLKLAGTSDCIGYYDGKLSIIDFKTSRKNKIVQWIEDYFIQATAYAIMYQEHVPEKIDQIVIILSSEDTQSEVFIKDPLDYKDLLFERIAQYYANL